MADEVFSVGFKIDSSNVEGDAEAAGRLAKQGFERGFGALELKPKITRDEQGRFASALGELHSATAAHVGKINETLAKIGLPENFGEKVTNQLDLARHHAGAEEGFGKKIAEGADVAKEGVEGLAKAFGGLTEFLAGGSLTSLARTFGVMGESTGELVTKFGILPETALKAGGAITAVGAAGYEAAKGSTELVDKAGELVIGMDELSKATGISKGSILGHREAFKDLGLDFNEFSRGLAHAQLVMQRAHAAIAREVSEEGDQTAVAQARVVESYRKREDAVSSLGDLQDKVFGARGALAAQRVGGREEAAIAEVRGPLTVEGARVGVAGAGAQAEAADIRRRQFEGERVTPQEIYQAQRDQIEASSAAADVNLKEAQLRYREAQNQERERQAGVRAEGGPGAIVQRQLAAAFREAMRADREEQRGEAAIPAAQREIGAAARAQAFLPSQQVGAVSEALMGRRRDINLGEVDPSVLTRALFFLGGGPGFGGPGGTGPEGVLQSIVKRFGTGPESQYPTLAPTLGAALFGRGITGGGAYLEGLGGLTEDQLRAAQQHRETAQETANYGEDSVKLFRDARAGLLQLRSALDEGAITGGRAAAPGVIEARGAEARLVRAITPEAAAQAGDVSGAIGSLTSTIEAGAEGVGGAIKKLTDALGGGDVGGRGIRETGETALIAGGGAVGATAGVSALRGFLRLIGLGGAAAGGAGAAVGGEALGAVGGAATGARFGAFGGPIGVLAGAGIGAVIALVAERLLAGGGAAKPEEPKPAPTPEPAPAPAPVSAAAPASAPIMVGRGGVATQVQVPLEGQAPPVAPLAPAVMPATAPAPAVSGLEGAAGALNGAAGALSGAAGALNGAAGALSSAGAAHAAAAAPAPAASAGSDTAVEQAEGGLIQGSGDDTSDSIHIMASPHEYVVKAARVRQLGVPFLDRLNRGEFASGGLITGFAEGGVVDGVDLRDTPPAKLADLFDWLGKVLDVSGAYPIPPEQQAPTMAPSGQPTVRHVVQPTRGPPPVTIDLSGRYPIPPEQQAPTIAPSGQPTAHAGQPRRPPRRRPLSAAPSTPFEPTFPTAPTPTFPTAPFEPTFPFEPPPAPPKMAQIEVQRHGAPETVPASYAVPEYTPEMEATEKARGFTWRGGPDIDLTKPEESRFADIDVRTPEDKAPRQRQLERIPDVELQRVPAAAFAMGGLIPARVSNGEYRMGAGAVSRLGVGFMDNLNAGRFQFGGPVSERAFLPSASWFSGRQWAAGQAEAAQVYGAATQGAGFASQYSFGNVGLTSLGRLPTGVPAGGGAISEHTLNLMTTGGTFTVSASANTIAAIQASAIGSRLTSTGSKPSWY